jgi:peptide/nickel transport system permease protein
LRKIFHSILVLFGISIVIFVIARMLPGDPARLVLGPMATQEQVQNLRHKMGMDKPLYVQYVTYVQGVFRGDLGLSFLSRQSVTLDIVHYLPATLELVVMAVIWTLVIGVPMGVLAARFKDSWFDNVTRILAFVGVAVPSFVLGLMGQLLFSYVLKILPTAGRTSLLTVIPPVRTGFLILDSLLAWDLGAMKDALGHILLPSFSLAIPGIGQITRLTRASVSDVLGKDYIEAARAFGIPDAYVTFKYMLRPSFIAPLTVLGLIFASQLGNAFLIEQVFAWPGMAKYGINAIMEKDFNAIMGVVLVVGLAFIVVNFVVDMLSGVVDPRIRIQERAEA